MEPVIDEGDNEDGDQEEGGDEEVKQPITEMPLLDAVQTLVEKERELMALKVAEAADEIKAWKDKYSVLAASTAHLADLTSEELVPSQDDPNKLSHWELLHAPLEGSVAGALSRLKHIDLSGEGLAAADLEFLARKMSKLPRSPVVCLAHNNVDEHCAKPLSWLLAKPMQALDLGHNELGPLCLVALCASLASKGQRELQRMSLEGNWHLACNPGTGNELGKSLCEGSRSLTNLTALRLTLCDDAPNRAAVLPWQQQQQQEQAQQQQQRTAASSQGGGTGQGGGTAARDANLRGGKPHNALHFLKHFSKPTFPRSLVELALTGAHLCKDSVHALASVLGEERCVVQTLTRHPNSVSASMFLSLSLSQLFLSLSLACLYAEMIFLSFTRSLVMTGAL